MCIRDSGRVVDGAWLNLLGDSGYALGARAGQIRDGLQAARQFDEAGFLALQLDDRALFLQRWRDLDVYKRQNYPSSPPRTTWPNPNTPLAAACGYSTCAAATVT